MAGSLEGVRAKLQRARVHQQELDRKWVRWLEEGPVTVSQERVDADGIIWLRWREPPPLPSDLPLIFGDMLVNARSALDHLVWQLVLANGGTPTKDHAFPIVRRVEHWDDAARRRLKGIDDEWLPVVRQAQPCLDAEPELHPLSVLDELANLSKHRTLQRAAVFLAGLSADANFHEPAPHGLTWQWVPINPSVVEDGEAVIGLILDPVVDVTIEPHPHGLAGLTFLDDIPHRDAFPDLIRVVEDLVAVFEPAFFG